MEKPRLLPIVLCMLLAACGSDEEEINVANKPACIVEVASRLQTCAEDNECERGVARFAGYCYNTAPGDQLDICRGGQYFFEQPLKALSESHEVVKNLDRRLREVVIRSGELYCQYNHN